MLAYCDGACRVSNPGEASAAFAVYDNVGLLHSSSRYLGPLLRTNNWAEFTALLDCLRWAEEFGARRMAIHCDSQLVVKTVTGEWDVKHEELKPLHTLATALMIRGEHTLLWIRGHEQAEEEADRVGNTLADKLCNLELDKILGEKR